MLARCTDCRKIRRVRYDFGQPVCFDCLLVRKSETWNQYNHNALRARVEELEAEFEAFLMGFDCDYLDGCRSDQHENERCPTCNARWVLFKETNPDGTIAAERRKE